MRLKILLVLGVILVAASGTAAAKYASYRLAIDGPGMSSPGVIDKRRHVDRLSIATLMGTNRIRTKRPASTGPAYLLHYGFGVSDELGSRTEVIRKILYPFAGSGPVVRTPRRQMFDMSYGPVRFRAGWFEVPRWVLKKLESVGLPHTPPELEPARSAKTNFDPQSPGGPWIAGLAIAAVGATVVIARRVRA